MYAADPESPIRRAPIQPLTVRAPAGPAPPTDVASWRGGGFTPKIVSRAPARAPARAVTRRAASVAPKSTRPSVGNSATGTVAPVAAPAPPPMSVEDWLAQDTTWKSQQDQFNKAWSDYQAQALQSENQYRTGYTADVNKLKTARTQAGQELESDFASRALLGSGIYAKAYTDYVNDYDARQKALDTGLSDFLANLTSQKQNYKSEQDLSLEKAKQDAINRRAASLGL